MAAYDKLPPTARRALQDAAFDWATQPILTRHRRGRRGYLTGKDIAKTIARRDADAIEKDRTRVWGVRDGDGSARRRRRRRRS